MKDYGVFLSFIACGSQIASAQTYGLSNTNPEVFSKFRIAKTDLSAFWFNTALNYTSTKQSVFDDLGLNSSDLNSNLNASFIPQYLLLEGSDSRYLSLIAKATGSLLQS